MNKGRSEKGMLSAIADCLILFVGTIGSLWITGSWILPTVSCLSGLSLLGFGLYNWSGSNDRPSTSILETVAQLEDLLHVDQAHRDFSLQFRLERLLERVTRTQATIQELEANVDAADSTRSQFLSNMSHEIRTPLNAVVGLSHALLDTRLSDQQRQDVQHIVDASDSIVTLVTDILDLTTIQSGKFVSSLAVENLRTLLEEVLESFKRRASEKSLHLLIDYEESIPSVFVFDSRSVRQIVRCLVDNAVKFCLPGRAVALTIRGTPAPGDMMNLEIFVIDSGEGIEEAQFKNLCQLFRQGNGMSTRSVGGLGIGLSLSSKLATLLGGDLVCRSKKGVGSVFKFSIPLQVAPRHIASSITEPVKTPAPVIPSKTSSLSVLIVEDNLMNAKVAIRMLEHLDADVTIAENGQEALEILERKTFDLILMDCQMPIMDGLEATRRIRQKEALTQKRVPIIALTGNAMAEDRDNCLKAGMDDYMTKPVSRQEFLTKITEFLENTPRPPSSNMQ